MRLTLLDFIAQTKSRYLKESFKDIDTVRNIEIAARSGLFRYLKYTEVHGVPGNRTISQFTSQIMCSIFRLHARLA